MRTLIARISPALLVALLAATATAKTQDFDRFKALAGEWEGKMSDGNPVGCSYAVTAAGSVVMETLHTPDHGDMVTMYRMDGPRLTMDHYCSMGNQPRMRAVPSAAGGNAVNFTFVSATNLAGPDAPHMHHLKVTFVDADHMTQEWTMHAGKSQDHVAKFEFARKQ
jgi:hypothetical protein